MGYFQVFLPSLPLFYVYFVGWRSDYTAAQNIAMKQWVLREIVSSAFTSLVLPPHCSRRSDYPAAQKTEMKQRV
jgi:hypothetical protein